MKFYKVEENKFTGFYDKEINDLFKDGKLKEGYFELSEEKWQALLDGQSQGKEIKILKDGSLGLYEKPVYKGSDLVKPVWNEDKETWKEGAVKEEILIERKNKILEYKKIKNEVADLEEMAELDEDFASPETIKILKEKMAELKQGIKKLGEIARKLPN